MKGFRGVIKLRMLRWEMILDYFSGFFLNVIIVFCGGGRGRVDMEEVMRLFWKRERFEDCFKICIWYWFRLDMFNV